MTIPNDFSVLDGHDYMSLTTFRKSGDPVPTPVWFAQVAGRLYVTTMGDSGKAKRLRHTPRVTVAPCERMGEVIGPAVAGVGRILPEGETAAAETALAQKYGAQWEAIMQQAQERPASPLRIFLEIAPAAG